MARPRKTTKLNRRLFVRVTEEELLRVRSNAKKLELTVSEYVRRLGVEGKVKIRQQQSAFGVSLVHQLKRIGVNLNQLTRLANIHDELPPELANLCKRIETILDRVLDLEKGGGDGSA
jgi:hypothetical protein